MPPVMTGSSDAPPVIRRCATNRVADPNISNQHIADIVQAQVFMQPLACTRGGLVRDDKPGVTREVQSKQPLKGSDIVHIHTFQREATPCLSS
jgi:hypothetical protein